MHREVRILGAGPSLHHLDCDGRVMVAINHTWKFTDRVDWHFVTDLENLNALREPIKHAANLVVPTYLVKNSKWCHERQSLIPGHLIPRHLVEIDHPRVWTYRFSTSDPRDNSQPYFGNLRSTGEAAVAFMLMLGYRTFATAGIDPAGYLPAYGGEGMPRFPDHMLADNYQRIQLRIEFAGGTLARLVPPAA